MSTIECSDAPWPLATVTFRGNLADEDFDKYLAFLERCHTRGEVWALLLEATNVRGVSATQRRRMADFLREHGDLARRYCAGTAFVIDSPLIRGTLTAIFWFQKQPTPYVIVAKREQAVLWLREQVEKYGSSLPAVLRWA